VEEILLDSEKKEEDENTTVRKRVIKTEEAES